MAGLYQVQGIVLSTQDFREADRILHILTPNRGKITAIAKGVRKAHSNLRSGTQRLCLARFLLYDGRSMATVTQCQVEDFFAPLRADLERLLTACYLAEIADVSVPAGQASPEMFGLLRRSLGLLVRENPHLVARAFEARAISVLGFAPRVNLCAACGAPLEEGLIPFAPAAGGALCSRCSRQYGAQYRVSREALAVWRNLASMGGSHLSRLKLSPRCQRELAEILPAYLEYYLDRRLKSRILMEQIREDAYEYGTRKN
ncbi:MAG: DNA repair protein RecO [Thermoanaerobacteraceae bacterium]|uniref:DNA repair protein RecO n=1 Tax=Thermanaeromonas sp. C210 TaxID=2731925 RepID=UPI00155B793E|nr:DNA repair protein RecO [Thermanaeromonas sp. C210]MBE3580147.1 DNA repair protein RecO [Thermoanaerobacteraceae bacterium]GFN22505.1 DNA repair protein RecO [Thermanaeromonas sp. C210]